MYLKNKSEIPPVQSEIFPQDPERFHAQRSGKDAFGEVKLQEDKVDSELVLRRLDVW